MNMSVTTPRPKDMLPRSCKRWRTGGGWNWIYIPADFPKPRHREGRSCFMCVSVLDGAHTEWMDHFTVNTNQCKKLRIILDENIYTHRLPWLKLHIPLVWRPPIKPRLLSYPVVQRRTRTWERSLSIRRDWDRKHDPPKILWATNCWSWLCRCQ
jgi:hypothetical protein